MAALEVLALDEATPQIRAPGASDTYVMPRNVEVRNGTTATKVEVYNTFTNASNYERGKFTWNANVLEIGTEAAGTGGARALLLTAGGLIDIKSALSGIQIWTSNAQTWQFSSGGVLLCNTDNAQDIGQAGANRPRDVHIGRDLRVAGRTHVSVVATASLPAAGAAEDGRVLIEDAAAGDRNLIIYAGGQRFRIDGGVAF